MNQHVRSIRLLLNMIAIPIGLVLLLVAPGALASDYAAAIFVEGPYGVETRLEIWEDEARGRALPIKLYIPTGAPTGPTVVFSHGLGGSREAAGYLGTHWASHGIIGIFVQHPGSDADVWKGLKGRKVLEALREAASKPQVTIDRFNDIPFVVDRIETLIAEGALSGDASRIGMAGHSFGARSTLAALGRGYNVAGARQTFEEPRIVAGLALSPEAVSETDEDQLELMFGKMKTPLFHVTGTKDAPPLGIPGAPADRRRPFALIPATPQYLVVFEGADHAVFSGGGLRRRPAPSWYTEVQGITATLSTAWWKARLEGDEEAAAWLAGAKADTGAATVLREGDVIKSK